jgi:hypothetical protein
MVASYEKEKKRKKDSSNSIWWQGVVGKNGQITIRALQMQLPRDKLHPFSVDITTVQKRDR